MKKFVCVLLIFSLILCSNAVFAVNNSVVLSETETVTEETAFRDNAVILTMTNEASLNFKDYSPADFPEVSCSSVTVLNPHTTADIEETVIEQAVMMQQELASGYALSDSANSERIAEYNQILLLTLSEAGTQQVLDAIASLEAREDVLYAEPDSILEPTSTAPNDTYYSSQYASSAINLPDAWDITTGSVSVYVGVVDSGIDATHPDLANRVYTSASRNCVDPGNVTTSGAHTDHSGHGTRVAGIIGAQGNNGIGVSGVCWNVNLVSLKISDDTHMMDMSSVIAAIEYATQTFRDIYLPDIRILNFSCGEIGAPSLQDSIDDYKAYGGVIVCSAGNDSMNTDNICYYPAYYTTTSDNVISVGAMNIGGGILQTMTNNDGTVIGGSNYGATSVDIFAPGQNILTCYPESLCTGHTSGTINHMYTGYHLMGQTSAAAAFVSGVAALMLSVNPDLTAAEVKSIINSTATYSSNFAGKCVSDGKLNAYAAVYEAYCRISTR